MFPWLPTGPNLYQTLAVAGDVGALWWQVLCQFRARTVEAIGELLIMRDDLAARGHIYERAGRWYVHHQPEQLMLEL